MAARTLRDVRAHDQLGIELSSDRLAMVVLPGFGGRSSHSVIGEAA